MSTELNDSTTYAIATSAMAAKLCRTAATALNLSARALQRNGNHSAATAARAAARGASSAASRAVSTPVLRDLNLTSPSLKTNA